MDDMDRVYKAMDVVGNFISDKVSPEDRRELWEHYGWLRVCLVEQAQKLRQAEEREVK